MLYIGEPSDGNSQNFPGTGNTADDAGHHYSDNLYFSWCGVGASDAALWFWPYPPNDNAASKVYDPMMSGQYSSWNAKDIDSTYRLRGYMIQLADQTKAPTWVRAGMLNQSWYQSNEKGGVTLQVVRDALNWEASTTAPLATGRITSTSPTGIAPSTVLRTTRTTCMTRCTRTSWMTSTSATFRCSWSYQQTPSQTGPTAIP